MWYDSFVYDVTHSLAWRRNDLWVLAHSNACHNAFIDMTELYAWRRRAHGTGLYKKSGNVSNAWIPLERAVPIWIPRAVPIQIPNRNRNRFGTSHTQCVTFLTVTKCHSLNLWPRSHALFFFKKKLSKQIWSHLGHKCHKWSQNQMLLVQIYFCFYFDWHGSEWMKSGKTY